MNPQLLNRHLRFAVLRNGGATAVEYSLVVSLIAIAIISAVSLFAGSVNGLFISNASSI